MVPLIDLAPDASANPLARELAGWLHAHLADHPAKRREFDRLRGSLALVPVGAAGALTLRFERGRLSIHGGVLGTPDLTVHGRAEALRALASVVRAGLPSPSTLVGLARRRDLTVFAELPAALGVRVEGLLLHAPLALGLVRLAVARG